MNNLNNNHANILDLPDEILFIILQKLDMVHVLGSLVDVNSRFYRLALDPLYIHDLKMTMKSLHGETFSKDTQVLSRICQKILPHIHHQVHKLTVEQQYSMNEILAAGTYPQLHSLSLLDFEESMLDQYLTSDSNLHDLLIKQIVHLDIGIKMMTDKWSITIAKIFSLILSLCKKLTVLNIGDILPTSKCLIAMVNLRSETSMSSSLMKLKINVPCFLDCLYLLDGRLDSLSTLVINVEQIFDHPSYVFEIKKPCKLKCFSLTSINTTVLYDGLVVPLLCQMTNLEELNLCLSVFRVNSTYIDGNQFYEQFLIYMGKLNKFTFNINTKVRNHRDEQIQLPSNEDIQRSFIRKGYEKVVSNVHLHSFGTRMQIGKCHIYSLPFQFEHFVKLDNYFQGGRFHQVRYLKMEDEIAFEHELFEIISQDFPFLEYLYISNRDSQKNKQHSSILLTFPYLIHLDVSFGHIDYAKLFLLKTNAHLPCLSNLCIETESLMEITNFFTKNAKHFNFGSLKNLDLCHPFIRPENFHEYFPLL